MVVAMLVAGCGGSDDAAQPAGPAPLVTEIVEASAAANAVQFDFDIESGGTVVLSSSGVLDAVGMIGYRTDEVGLEGTGLEPAAQVWLEAGELLESQNDEPITSINGGLSNFLGVNDPGASESLGGVLTAWLGASTTTFVTNDSIDGVPVRQLLVTRQDDESIEVWVDSNERLVKVVDVGTQLQPITTTHEFKYPDEVSIPPRPD